MNRPRSKAQILTWLREHVYVRDECRIWAGATHSQGFPLICWLPRGRALNAGLLLLELTGHPIPDRPVVWRTCGNLQCMAREHLRVGTRAEMVRTFAAEGRYPTGAARSIASAAGWRAREPRLGIDKAREVALQLAHGSTCADVATRYGVHQTTVSKAMQRWRRCGLVA